MKRRYLLIAGFCIEILPQRMLYTHRIKQQFLEQTLSYVRGFMLNKQPISIDGRITIADYDNYRLIIDNHNVSFLEMCVYTDRRHITTYYYVSSYQFILLLNYFVAGLLAVHDGIILHGSAVAIKGKAHVFLGKEGAGKSTILTLLSPSFQPLADDHLYIRKIDDEYRLYQSLHLDKITMIAKSSAAYPLGGIYFLQKGIGISSKRIQKTSASQLLLEDLPLPKYDASLFIQNALQFVESYKNFFTLTFALDQKKVRKYFNEHT